MYNELRNHDDIQKRFFSRRKNFFILKSRPSKKLEWKIREQGDDLDIQFSLHGTVYLRF